MAHDLKNEFFDIVSGITVISGITTAPTIEVHDPKILKLEYSQLVDISSTQGEI